MGENDCGGNWVLWYVGLYSGQGCVPSLLLTWDQTMVEVMKIMVTSFKRSRGCTASLSAPDPAAGHHWPTPPPETPGHSRASLGQSLVGSLLLSPGSWSAKVLFVPSKSLSPHSCENSGGSMVGLMAVSSKRAYATPRSDAPRAPGPVAGHCWPVPPQETLKHSKAGLVQSLWGLLVCTRCWALWASMYTHLDNVLVWSLDSGRRFSSVQFSCSVVSDSLWPHESQHARPPCPSPTPGVHLNSCPSSQWCHPAISSSIVPFSSCPQSLPASGSSLMSQLFARGGQSTGVSASASVLPMNTQDWSPLRWTGWISLQSKGLSRVFSNTTVQKQGGYLSLNPISLI